MIKRLLIAVASLAVVSNVAAADSKIELDPASTSITFRLKATMHSVHGKAKTTSGSLTLDIDSGDMTGEVVVDAVSAETGNKKRDKKMHTKVLRSADHSRIVLRPHRIDGNLAHAGVSDVTLFGEMELLGQSHEIHIPLHVEIIDGRFTASTEFRIPYVEWGLDDPSTFVLRVAKVVQVTVFAEGTISNSN
jgi:hypothetical protein